MEWVIILMTTLGLALVFGAGASVSHALDISHTQVQTETMSAEQHRKIASDLLYRSLHSKDPELQKRLRSDALTHFIQADVLENGPYKV